MKHTPFILFVFLIFLFYHTQGYAYNLKQLSGREGLSNSAVIHIMQDSRQVMWIGTYDGLNSYDGMNIHIYKPTGEKNSIAGNIIRRILETDENILWIQTNLGITKFHKEEGVINTYLRNNFQIMAKNSKDQIFSIIQTDSIFMYNPAKDLFVPYTLDSLYREVIRHFSFDSNDILWILNLHGVLKRYKIETDENGVVSVVNMPSFEYPERIRYTFAKQDFLFIIGDKGSLSVIDRKSGNIRFIRNLKNELDQYGIVGDIIGDDGDILVALSTNGVLRLYPNSLGEYEVEKIDLDCGVFSFYKDEKQNIVWFGTDGQGAIIYSKDAHSFKSETFNNWYDLVKKPVRSIFLDREKNLWVGTKGDGILKRNNFTQNGSIQLNDLSVYRVENSELINNSVFTFAPGYRDIFWIGSDGPGLNYYSYQTGKIHTTESTSSNKLTFTQSIYQQNDTLLWIGSSGDGLSKVILTYKQDKPVIKQISRRHFFESNNKYFSVIPENDSIIWVGSRVNGAVRYNTNTGKHRVIRFPKEEEQLLNDILCIFKDSRNDIWFGTSLGLVRLLSFENEIEYKIYNELNGLPNNTVHGILEGHNQVLWLSTNNGIVEFNSEKETFKHVNYKNGIDVFEFCDNAYYQHANPEVLFFGGVNGLVSVVPDQNEKQVYHPDISFYGLKIYGKDVYMDTYLKTQKRKTWLELPYNSNFFSISYIAIDYVDASNYVYEYKLENFSNQWISNGASNIVSFTNIPPGNYNLLVRYRNSSIWQNSDIYSFPIVITPPWYHTTVAYLIYFVLSLVAGFLLARIVRKWYQMKKGVVISQLKQEQKEKIYESQFRFFTNVTHELCTPLTLIQGPTEKIVEYDKADAYVHKYALLIQRNVEKLNQLIKDLIDFRRMETGHKKLELIRLNLSEQTLELTGAFSEWAESKKIIYQMEIEEGILWNTDTGSYSGIVNNLLSNAFKYVNPQGTVKCKLYQENGQLIFSVSNTGKGIKSEDIPKIFDRYRILNNFGMQSKGERPVRNGLGLAICHSMVESLKGYITVTSLPDEWTTFKVVLPELVEDTGKEGLTDSGPDTIHMIEENPDLSIVDYRNFDPAKATILIVDDDEEILWFVAGLFVEKYNIVPLSDSSKVMDFLKVNRVNLILMDIMMPGIDGLTLTKEIKADKLISHIPLILLSAKGNNESKTEGIEAGAEMYITKPFNTHYLEKVVDRLLRHKEEMKEYYNSSISSFDMEEGRLINQESKAFYTKLMRIIEENISNPDFSVEILSSSLGVSSRHLYRRLKEITDKTPNELIKDYRFKKAEKLLTTTNMSVDEIIYETGFNNRGNFFRLFSQRYGTTPKKYREEALRKIKR